MTVPGRSPTGSSAPPSNPAAGASRKLALSSYAFNRARTLWPSAVSPPQTCCR
jgi:hypothetical protein